MMSRTTVAILAVALFTVPATAQEELEGRACCLGLPSLECEVAPSGAACLEGPGLPVPGDLCCAVRDVVDLGCFGAPCYSGPAGTAGVGACREGAWTCGEDGAITCEGEVTPVAETCNFVDDDCNGVTDDGFDQDGDGFTTCGGDCNDGNPSVHPGAPETCNGIDDDCNGQIDQSGASCPAGQNASGVCSSGQCFQVCNAGFGDCDQNPFSGCEANLSADSLHCGACNNFCPSGICVSGTCIQ